MSIDLATCPNINVGYKQSGYGRESGAEGLKEYLQPKTIHINMNVGAKR